MNSLLSIAVMYNIMDRKETSHSGVPASVQDNRYTRSPHSGDNKRLLAFTKNTLLFTHDDDGGDSDHTESIIQSLFPVRMVEI